MRHFTFPPLVRLSALTGLLVLACAFVCSSQDSRSKDTTGIDLSFFRDSQHHWYDIRDDGTIIFPLPGQTMYNPSQVCEIADNILLYQKSNGGWPKNYDMMAILTDGQKLALERARQHTNTTFDNGATHSHVEYLARAYSVTREDRFKDACTRGIDFILRAQYANGGYPQFYPNTNGYAKHITFNDGAMIGVMTVLRNIVYGETQYSFLDTARRKRVQQAFDKGIQCILNCQIIGNGVRSVWCQQHDSKNFLPQNARTFELASICNQESAEIALFLMSLQNPSHEVVKAVHAAVQWFQQSRIFGVREKIIDAPMEQFRYHRTNKDKIVEADSSAPPVWTRFNELETHRPLFCRRSGQRVYSLAEVERERRTGYGWYTYAPQEVLDKHVDWKLSIGKSSHGVERDTSFTVWSAFEKVKKGFPHVQIAEPKLPAGVTVVDNTVYASYGERKLHLDLFIPPKKDRKPGPAVLLIHGGGWASGDKSQQVPLAQQLAARGYVAATAEYRLSPESLFPAAIYDLKAAVRWLRAHANEYHIDEKKIAALGCSAGGQLAAFLGTTNGVQQYEGPGGNQPFSSSVQAVVNMDGILDFTHPAESGKDTIPDKPSVGKRWLGASYKENPWIWIEASPLTHVDKNTAPILFINSSLDRFHAGRDEMIDKLKKLNIRSEDHTIPSTPHTFWLFHPWFEPTVRFAAEFLDRVFKK